MFCLLYTSDAADDMQCVDLGGRRIIKKKFFQAEDGIRDFCLSRGLGDVYKRQVSNDVIGLLHFHAIYSFDTYIIQDVGVKRYFGQTNFI